MSRDTAYLYLYFLPLFTLVFANIGESPLVNVLHAWWSCVCVCLHMCVSARVCVFAPVWLKAYVPMCPSPPGAVLFCKRFGRMQRWFPLCATLTLFVLAPATLWIAGGVFMPLTLAFGDACSSMENVEWQV